MQKNKGRIRFLLSDPVYLFSRAGFGFFSRVEIQIWVFFTGLIHFFSLGSDPDSVISRGSYPDPFFSRGLDPDLVFLEGRTRIRFFKLSGPGSSRVESYPDFFKWSDIVFFSTVSSGFL